MLSRARSLVSPLLSSLVLAVLASGSLGGCAKGGAANATAPGSSARGGDAHNDIRMSFNLSLGDAVAKAAADTVHNIMSPAAAAGTITDDQKEEAVQAGIAAGLDEAAKEGKTPTDADKAELEKGVREVADAEQQHPTP